MDLLPLLVVLMVSTLWLGLRLGWRDPWLPKLCYLVPFVIANVFAAIVPQLIHSGLDFGARDAELSSTWVWLFGGIEVLAIGWALYANRNNPRAALSFGLFLALYAIAAVLWVIVTLICFRAC